MKILFIQELQIFLIEHFEREAMFISISLDSKLDSKGFLSNFFFAVKNFFVGSKIVIAYIYFIIFSANEIIHRSFNFIEQFL